MSLLDSLLSSLTGSGDNYDFTPPHALCPSSCPIGPEACERCLPYKQRLNDALYNVDHLEEFLDRYVVETVSTGATECPHCGAPSADPFICEYCGLQIRPDDGKIRVASANDIPDPILEARDIVYERQSVIVIPFSNSTDGGLLSGLLDLFDGSAKPELGARMSKEDIQQAAELYGVSVANYLNGLDNGIYLTLEKKQAQDRAGQLSSGIVDLGYTGGSVLGDVLNHLPRRPPSRPHRPPVQQPQSVHQAQRPASRPQQSFSKPQQNSLKPAQMPRPQPPKNDKPLGSSFNRVDPFRRSDVSKPTKPQQGVSRFQSMKSQPPQRPKPAAPKGKDSGNPGINSLKGRKK